LGKQKNKAGTKLEREVASRFGVVPNFFKSAPEAPEVGNSFWQFSKSAYLDSPLPPLLKERLFVYLSRFCEVRYCIIRHFGFLIGKGHPSGDPEATATAIQEAIALLKRPVPWARDMEGVYVRLAGLEAPLPGWPEPGSELEDLVFACATLMFVEPHRNDRVRRTLRTALGPRPFELLMAFLAFVRMGHYWTLTHPEIEIDADMERLLRANKELARLLLDDPEAHRATPSRRPAAELTTERPTRARHRGRKTCDLDWHVAGQVHLQRVRHGLSLNQLAGRVGISPQQLFKYEQGTNRITVARLYVIAQELGVPIASFFRGFRPDER
jgi:hypothetical protein